MHRCIIYLYINVTIYLLDNTILPIQSNSKLFLSRLSSIFVFIWPIIIKTMQRYSLGLNTHIPFTVATFDTSASRVNNIYEKGCLATSFSPVEWVLTCTEYNIRSIYTKFYRFNILRIYICFMYFLFNFYGLFYIFKPITY